MWENNNLNKSPNKLFYTPWRDDYAGLSCGCYCCWLQPDLVSQATRAGSRDAISSAGAEVFSLKLARHHREDRDRGKEKNTGHRYWKRCQKSHAWRQMEPMCSALACPLGSQDDSSRSSVGTFCNVMFLSITQRMQKIQNNFYLFRWLKSYGSKEVS